jgi:hypothetical protein
MLGEFLPNFDLKNMILSYSKDFSWGGGGKQATKNPCLEDFFFQIVRFL